MYSIAIYLRLEEKEIQLATLRIELSKEKTELDRIKMQVETLRSEASKQHSHVQQLQDDLDAQRTKNNVSFSKS